MSATWIVLIIGQIVTWAAAYHLGRRTFVSRTFVSRETWKARKAAMQPPRIDPMADHYTSSGTLRIFDGDQPVCHHIMPSDQNMLAELHWEAEGPSVGGVLRLHVEPAKILRDGTARWWRLYTSEGVALKDSGCTADRRYATGNLYLNTVELYAGGAIAIPSMTLSQRPDPKERRAV